MLAHVRSSPRLRAGDGTNRTVSAPVRAMPSYAGSWRSDDRPRNGHFRGNQSLDEASWPLGACGQHNPPGNPALKRRSRPAGWGHPAGAAHAPVQVRQAHGVAGLLVAGRWLPVSRAAIDLDAEPLAARSLLTRSLVGGLGNVVVVDPVGQLRGSRSCGPAAKLDAHRHLPNAEQTIAGHPFDRPRWREGFDPRQQFGEGQPNLHARQAGAKADMGVEAEGDVTVGRAGNIKSEGFIEHGGIAIGRHLPVGDLVTGLDAMALVVHLARCRAALVDRGRGPAQDLVDGDAHLADVGPAQLLQLLWVLAQRPQTAGDGAARRLGASRK